MTLPDFSPAMLSLFLRARVVFAHAAAPRRSITTVAKRERDRLRKAAGVTVADMDMAWMGRLLSPAPRARLWGALGHVPADAGVLLTHGGQEAGGEDQADG